MFEFQSRINNLNSRDLRYGTAKLFLHVESFTLSYRVVDSTRLDFEAALTIVTSTFRTRIEQSQFIHTGSACRDLRYGMGKCFSTWGHLHLHIGLPPDLDPLQTQGCLSTLANSDKIEQSQFIHTRSSCRDLRFGTAKLFLHVE